MHGLNRTAHAPRSAAIFLFLGLAILPVSLKVAGFRVGFNPSLSGAVDAWQQMAEVFGAGSQQTPTLTVSSTNDLKTEPLIAVEAAHAIRMPAMAGKSVGFMAVVPLEAFLTVTMPLAFFKKNEGARSIR
jgi:hypothetical protein